MPKKSDPLLKLVERIKENEKYLHSFLDSEDTLFHYTTSSVALENILHHKKFKLSKFVRTGDPKEYKDILFNIAFHFLATNEDEKEEITQKEKAQGQINSILKEKIRVICLCTNSDKNGWSKFRMWSQYGEGHSGICLVFSKKKLENYLRNNLEDVYYKTGDVEYKKYDFQYGKSFDIDINTLKKLGIESYCTDHLKKHIQYFCFQKNIDYKDESEYRVIIFDFNNKYEYLDISDFIEWIIVGERTSKVYDATIADIRSKFPINCARLSYNKDQLHLINFRPS